MFLSVDPGKNIGLASFNQEGEDLARKTVSLDYFPSFLEAVYTLSKDAKEPVVFIYEDYTLRKDKAIEQTGSDMPASQAIGMIKMISRLLGDLARIEVVKAGNLRTALKWAGYPELANKPRTWHCPDDLAAYAHGVMWLINNKIRKHPIFES